MPNVECSVNGWCQWMQVYLQQMADENRSGESFDCCPGCKANLAPIRKALGIKTTKQKEVHTDTTFVCVPVYHRKPQRSWDEFLDGGFIDDAESFIDDIF